MANISFLTWAWPATGGTTYRPAPDRVLNDAVHVNDFYPPTKLGASYVATFGPPTAFGTPTLANGKSNPASNFFNSFAAAQAAYPFLQNTNSAALCYWNGGIIEIDYCAWMAALGLCLQLL